MRGRWRPFRGSPAGMVSPEEKSEYQALVNQIGKFLETGWDGTAAPGDVVQAVSEVFTNFRWEQDDKHEMTYYTDQVDNIALELRERFEFYVDGDEQEED